MKNGKVSQSLEHIDDELIASAMYDSELNPKNADLKRRKTMKKTSTLKKLTAIAAAFALVITGGFLIARFAGDSSAVIALDVNPSIELQVDRNEKIEEVRALNEDAQIVIGEMELEDVKLDVAINAIIGSMMKNGYLSTEQNSILISVDAKSNASADKLKEKISTDVNALLGESNIDASVITQNFKDNEQTSKIAKENKISKAKAALIAKIVDAGLCDANGVPYTHETLAQLKVNELKVILEFKELTVDGIISSGTASANSYITREAALAAALAKAGVEEQNITRVEVELDFEDDVNAMVYEVEFRFDGKKYEYEVLASNEKNAEIVYEEIKPDDKDDDDKHETKPTVEVIDKKAALEIAYKHASIDAKNAKRAKIELDKEGNTYIYEIEFKADGKEYEYEINAVTGEVIGFEVEIDD